MIGKGAARGEPRQLGPYLMRTGRYDTGEKARLLELRSPWAAGLDGDREKTADLLSEAFSDWQTWCEGTKQGRDGLYHAQLNPALKYAKTMTDEQLLRCVDIFEEEIGFKGQPRAVVWQEGTDGRHHIHIAWARTDLDTMKLIPDSHNYWAHERATRRMEKEFGHDFVPGKHAKRDREAQPEFPRADSTYDDHMHAARTKMSLDERREQITGIRHAVDNAEAFKNALEEKGYLLARGDRRGFVLVDEHGEVFSLSKHVPGIKGKAFKEFMGSIDLAQLPDVEQAKDLQKTLRQQREVAKLDAAREQAADTVSKSDGQPEQPRKPEERAAEASQFLKDETPQKPAEPIQTRETVVSRPDGEERKPAPVDPERKRQITALRAWADGAQAFKKALEDAGYTLAQGTTGYVLFSEDGVFNLDKHAGMRKSAFEAFMSPIPLDSLPDVQALIDAKTQAREAQKESKHPGDEAPQFLSVDAPQQSSFLPPKDIDFAKRVELDALNMAAQAIAEAEKARQKSELEALEKAIAKRYEQEAAVLRERHEAELRAKEVAMDRQIARDMEVTIL